MPVVLFATWISEGGENVSSAGQLVSVAYFIVQGGLGMEKVR